MDYREEAINALESADDWESAKAQQVELTRALVFAILDVGAAIRESNKPTGDLEGCVMQETYAIRDGCNLVGWAYVMDVSMAVSYAPAAMLNQIHVIPKARGKGFGTKLMEQITEEADREGYTIVAGFEPEEFGSDPDRLMKFYESFDFYWDEKIHGLRREPR